MRYLNSSELSMFHDSLLRMFGKHATNIGQDSWGFPSGIHYCDTYSFNTKYGTLHVGHDDFIEAKRWWIPITLEEQVYGDQLPIAFEMCIPKTRNMQVSVHYAIDDNNVVHILHKGKFTVGHGSVSMSDFFDYYQKYPGKWQLMKFNYYDYLLLAKVNLVLADADFTQLLDSLAEFTRYIPNYKSNYRQ